MWPWDPPKPEMQEPELSRAMKLRLDELHERQDRFERIMKDIRLEWDEMYDKFRLLYARVAKRIKDAANAEPDAPEPREDAPESTIRPPVAYGHPPLPIARRKPAGGNYGG